MENPIKGCLQLGIILVLPIAVVGGLFALLIVTRVNHSRVVQRSYSENRQAELNPEASFEHSDHELAKPTIDPAAVMERIKKSKVENKESDQGSEKSGGEDPHKETDQEKFDSEIPTGTKAKTKVMVTRSTEPPDWYETQALNVQVVKTDLESPDQLMDALYDQAESAVQDHMSRQYGEACAALVSIDRETIKTAVLTRVHRQQLSAEKIRELFPNEQDTADLDLDSLEYEIGYAELQFDDNFNIYVNNEWQNRKQYERLWQLSVIAGGFFSLLTVVFGYLKIDSATRGMYSVRLLIATGLMTLIVIAIFNYALGQLVWI